MHVRTVEKCICMYSGGNMYVQLKNVYAYNVQKLCMYVQRKKCFFSKRLYIYVSRDIY
jgi:hypothetical protein